MPHMRTPTLDNTTKKQTSKLLLPSMQPNRNTRGSRMERQDALSQRD
jgi:hypothetical protein